MKLCNTCHHTIFLEDALFCPYCGEKLAIERDACKMCGYLLEQAFQFCPNCGAPTHPSLLETETSPEIKHWLEWREENVCPDYVVRCVDSFSYCLQDTRANDLRVIRTFVGEPDTIYYVTADVKTENVINHENKENPIGACISTNDWYCSESLLGTNDWKTLGVLGRSDVNGNIYVSLNLGYTCNTCSGTAWFENIRFTPVERFTDTARNTWRFLAVLLTDTGIDTEDEERGRIHLSHQMSHEARAVIRKSLIDFESDLNADANGLFDVRVDVVESAARCTAYTKTNMGYAIAAADARAYFLENGIDISGYDHVIVIVCQPNLPVTYYGLGGLRLQGNIGFSFVLHTGENNCIEYLSGRREGAWPPAIYVHEFLHSIEACANALGLPVPEVDGDRHGYPNEEEWRAWYRDFMAKKLPGGKGVDPRIWRLRPSLFF